MDLTDYPWVLYCQYDGKGAFVPEEGFTSLKDAQKSINIWGQSKNYAQAYVPPEMAYFGRVPTGDSALFGLLLSVTQRIAS